MTGGELQAAIVEAARMLGWRVAHFRAARTAHGWRTPVAADGAGWPDLCLVRERIIFAEIKGDGDRVRPDQQAWLDTLAAAGAAVYVWRPQDWTGGLVDPVPAPTRTEAA